MGRTGMSAGTTYSAGFVLPPHAVSEPLPCDRVPVGVDLLNRRQTVNLDPFALYLKKNPQILSDRNIVFIGHPGSGKSSLKKTFLERMLDLPEQLPDGRERDRRAVIIDRKGEYKNLAEAFGCRPTVIGHGVCLNPLDDRLTDQQQEVVLERFVSLLKHRLLEDFEVECVQQALKQARQKRDRSLVLEDVRHELLNLDDMFITESRRPRAVVDPLAADLASALRRLTSGALRGLFNGPTTETLDWSGQVIDITINDDYLVDDRELVYQLLVACLSVWLDRGWKADDDHRIDFLVVDEGWDVAKAQQFAQLLQDWTKLGRSRGICVMLALHRPSDYESAGNAGDKQVAIAKGLLMEMGTFALFHMKRQEANRLRDIAQLDDDAVDTIVGLQPHQFLLMVGGSDVTRRRFLVEHRLAEHEVELVDSDTR